MMLPIARRTVLKFAANGGLLLVAGCSVLFPAAAPRLFALRPPERDPSPPERLRWTLSVAAPDTPQALDTSRIALRRGRFELDYFADAAWPDHASGLVQGLLIDTVEATGRPRVVARDTLSVRTDFLLLTQLKDFQAQYSEGQTGTPEIHMRVVAQLARSADREILDSLDVDETRVASANSLDAIIAAFNQCAEAVVTRLTSWVLETGQHNYNTQP